MIIIDSREQHKTEIQSKLSVLGVESHITGLNNYVDYFIMSDLECHAIQRKSMGEVMAQMNEINLRVSELTGDVNWLLIEEDKFSIASSGSILVKRGDKQYETGTSIRSYYNFQHSIMKQGVHVKITRNWLQSVWWMYSLHEYIQGEHYPKGVRTYTQREEVMGLLMSIKNIGKSKANKIYDLFCDKGVI